MIKKDVKKTYRIFLAVVIVLLTAIFFIKEFQENISSAQSFNLILDFPNLLIAASFIIFAMIIQTYEWSFFINSVSKKNKINFFDAFTITNTSALTRYLPGKIWEYALQMQWLGNHGFSKSLIFYVNLILLVVNYLVVTLACCILLLILNPFNNISVMFILFSLFLMLNALLLIYKNMLFSKLIKLSDKYFKKKIEYHDISIKLILSVQGLHIFFLLAQFMSIYFVNKGVGLTLSVETTIVIFPAFLMSGLLSLVVFIVPGGIGIREGSMYIMLMMLIPKSYALIIPIAIRIIHMVVEFGVGMFSLIMLKKSFNNLKKRNYNHLQ